MNAANMSKIKDALQSISQLSGDTKYLSSSRKASLAGI